MKKVTRFLRIAIIGFMLAVCIVIGVAPVIPKRKEEYSIEIKIEKEQNNQEENMVMLKNRD